MRAAASISFKLELLVAKHAHAPNLRAGDVECSSRERPIIMRSLVVSSNYLCIAAVRKKFKIVLRKSS